MNTLISEQHKTAKELILSNRYCVINGERQSGKTSLVKDIVKSELLDKTGRNVIVLNATNSMGLNLKNDIEEELKNEYPIPNFSFDGNLPRFFPLNSNPSVESLLSSLIPKSFVIVDNTEFCKSELLETVASNQKVHSFVMVGTASDNPDKNHFFRRVIENTKNPKPWYMTPLFNYFELKSVNDYQMQEQIIKDLTNKVKTLEEKIKNIEKCKEDSADYLLTDYWDILYK